MDDLAQAALPLLETFRATIVDSHCRIGEGGTPRLETLEEEVKDIVARLDDAIAKCKAAPGRAGALLAATDAILRDAYASRAEIDGAVNWADLSGVAAGVMVDREGNATPTVIIEEASPNAAELQAYVRARLKERGFGDIAVQTEW